MFKYPGHFLGWLNPGHFFVWLNRTTFWAGWQPDEVSDEFSFIFFVLSRVLWGQVTAEANNEKTDEAGVSDEQTSIQKPPLSNIKSSHSLE